MTKELKYCEQCGTVFFTENDHCGVLMRPFQGIQQTCYGRLKSVIDYVNHEGWTMQDEEGILKKNEKVNSCKPESKN